ncbi:MAG: CAP domain-containing protein [Firmicutes bacterium]|nr:CAP domain-containing protein [Bacillota bacterium]
MSVKLPTDSLSRPAVTGGADAAGLTDDERLLFGLINRERIRAGLKMLSLDPRLVDLARLKSEEMFKNNYFSHISPVYGTALDMVKRKGITARVMGGENIAKAATTRRAHELIMNSEKHRANILNSLHDSIGIGIYRSRYGVLVTQLFLGH